MDLVPIKIRIGLKKDGSALYPDFNDLPIVAASGIDWSYYVDAEGSGWLYDCCGHKESEPGSPTGMQWGMLLVPAAFATDATDAFPADVTRLTSTEAVQFYDTQHAREFEDEEIRQDIVDAIRSKQALELALTPRQLDAIDPTTDTPGIRANPRKTFNSFITKRGITLAL